MKLSEFFIHRPVATTLLSVGIFLAGALGFKMLPVAPLPQVDFPTIFVQASLAGASPETMAATVAAPLERVLGRISGLSEITSNSSLGSSQVIMQFDLDKNINDAARETQAAINASRALLPTDMKSMPTYRKVNPADAPIMLLSLSSDTLSPGQIYDSASTILSQRLSQLGGVGQVTVGGSALPAVRVELNLPKLAQLNIGLESVRTAISNANQDGPKGYVHDNTGQWTILANDQAWTAVDYKKLVVGYSNGAPVRLSDVAQIIDSVQDVRNSGSVNGKPAILLIIFKQPGANIIDAVDNIKAVLPSLQQSIPASIHMHVVMERTASIRNSLHDVERALAFAICLVIAVVFVFLRSVRATFIPAVAVPLSLAGTLGLMWACGFSLNNLSLMALTVATGFVVDDAVVVLENIVRRIESGERPLEAAINGSREVAFTVMSMSISLVAVFIPVLFMGGIIGRLFKEFALTLSAAILVSMVVSLVVTPMMCARILKKIEEHVEDVATTPPAVRRGLPGFAALGGASAAAGRHIVNGYNKSLRWALMHSRTVLVLLAATIGLNLYLYGAIHKGFLPNQDIGMMMGFIQGDQSVSFQEMSKEIAQVVEIVRKDPAVGTVATFTGGGQRNQGHLFVILKPLAERNRLKVPSAAFDVINRLRPQTARIPGVSVQMFPMQDIHIGGRSAPAQYQYTLTSDNLEDLKKWEPKVLEAMKAMSELTDVNTDSADKGLQTVVNVNRDTASKLGIPMELVTGSLNDAFGQRQVSTIYKALNQYQVVMEGAPKYWQYPESLNEIRMVGSSNQQVPLSAVAKWGTNNTALVTNHQSGFPAATVSFNLAPGVSLNQATVAIDDMFARVGVPNVVRGSFAGTASAFQASLSSEPLLILAALVTIYLVLGMLYESTVHPWTILSTLPSAGIGALLALMAFNTEFTIIALIGVILLIGIVKKNAIMMVDVALALERDEGLSPLEAIHRACILRFRPIMMTTLAAMFGALPLALGTGDGAELRQPLGIAIMGGLAVSQVLTLYTTPIVYLVLDRVRHKVLRLRSKGLTA
jgi:multidrug efflux pump